MTESGNHIAQNIIFSTAVENRKSFLGSLANFSTSKNSFNSINNTIVNVENPENNNGSNSTPQPTSGNEQFSTIKTELVEKFIQFTEFQKVIKDLLTDYKLNTMDSDSPMDLNTYYTNNKSKYLLRNNDNTISKNPTEQILALQKGFEDTTNNFFNYIESKIDPIGNYFSSVNEKSSFCATLAEVKCFFDSWDDVKTQAYYLIDLLRETIGQKDENSLSSQSSPNINEPNPYHYEILKTIFDSK